MRTHALVAPLAMRKGPRPCGRHGNQQRSANGGGFPKMEAIRCHKHLSVEPNQANTATKKTIGPVWPCLALKWGGFQWLQHHCHLAVTSVLWCSLMKRAQPEGWQRFRETQGKYTFLCWEKIDITHDKETCEANMKPTNLARVATWGGERDGGSDGHW